MRGQFDGSPSSLARLEIVRASGSICAGKYRVFANIGRGGMADVLLGVAPGPKGVNKLLVIKRLRPAFAGDAEMLSMFLDEARLAARLSHPNLIQTFEVAEEDGGYFIIMEYLEGRPVSQIFDALKETSGSLPPEVWAKILAEALAGLHYAHELTDYDGVPLKIVHRDVSPQNIVVTFEGAVKLVDFGIAKASVNITETETGILKGKLAYMAPEQARGDEIDRRADIFSTGVVLWECLARSRLITGDAKAASKKLEDMQFLPPSSRNRAVPPELDAITMRALERDPAARFQTAEEMRDALEGYLRTSGHYVQESAIGAPIAKLFAEQREDVRAQIRMHMASLRSERKLAEAGGDDKAGGSSGQVEWPKEIGSLPKITESMRSVRAVHKSAPASASQNKWVWRAAAVGAGLIIVIAGVTVARGPSSPMPAAAASTAPAAPVPPPPATAAPTAVHVELRVSPPEATITLDDAPLPNPFTGSFMRDALEHRLQVTRDGYTSEGRLLRFDDGDVDLAITLATLPGAAPSAKPRAPVPAAGDAPRPKVLPRPHLDADPYR